MKTAAKPRGNRILSVLTAALLVAGGLMWALAAPAQAATCTTVGGFEIDGNMDPGTCGGNDWSNAPGVQSTSSIGTYNVVKDNSNPSGWSNGGGTPPKVDFTNVYAFTQVVGGDYFAYVGWERDQNSGTGGYAIEIDNAGTRVGSDGAPQPDRSAGGFVFYITTQGSAAPVLGESCAFTSQATYPGTCTTSQAGYTAAINNVQIHDPLANIDVPSGEFLEVGLDITTLTGIAPSCPAPAAASLYMRSFTGQNPGPTGNLKGYVAPFAVAPNSTCVAPHIDTTATPGNGTIDGLAVVVPGSTQHDNVTVGNFQGSPPGVGDVTFFLCSPTEVTANGGDCSANGTQVGNAVTLDGNGQASSADINGATTPNDNATGTYCWRVEFAPSPNDHNYFAGTHTNSDTECFTVAHASPTIATQSSATTGSGAATNSIGFTTIGDTATLSGVVSKADLTGQNVTFNLYGPLASAPGVNDCTVGALIDGPVTAPLTKVDDTTWHATAPTFEPTAADGPGFYTWIASYNGDQINDGKSGACGDANETVHLVGPLLTLTKGTPHSTITAGDDVVYDVNLGNVGDGSASSVVVTDVLPILAGGGTWTLTATSGYNCSLAAGTGVNLGHQVLTCNVGQLNPSTLTQIAELTAPTTTADCGTISNTAALAADPNVSQTAGPVNVTVQCPSLTISKSADAASVTVGNSIGFTVTVTNNGLGTATGVDIEDPLPTGAHISWSIASQTGPLTCSIVAGPKLSCTGSLGAGLSETVHITSPTAWNVDGNSCGTYSNTATVSADNAVIANPSANASEDVLCPNLVVNKTADAAAVDAGSPIGFTITASNTGAGSASGAVLSDPLPGSVTWVIDVANTTGPLSCSITAGTLTCSGTLTAGQVESVHVTAQTAFADCGTYDNTATLTASNTPQAPTAHASTQVQCANLVIHKTADAASVSVGSSIGFTVTISNNGAGAANAVDVEDPLPAGPGINWTLDGANTSGPLTCAVTGSVGAQTLSCTGTLSASGTANDSQTVHITSTTVWNADHNSCGVYDNTATATWGNGPANPTSSEQATETVLCPNLAITKTADDGTVSAGDDIGFTIVVTNAGPGAAAGVTIADPLQAGAGVDWSISPAYSGPGTCTINGAVGSQELDCSFGDLASGADVTVHITSATTGASCATYDNTATLHATNEPGIAPGSDSTTVQCPDPSIVKTADADTVDAGTQIGFTITASNGDAPGTGTAKGVVINDPLPGGPGIDWSIESGPAGCSVTGTAPAQTLVCAAVDLAPGESETVHVVSGTAFASCGTYDNTATLTLANGVAPDPASASSDVQCSSLTVVKTADNAKVAAGKQIGFTITASSGGPGIALGVTLEDVLPGGDGVSWSIDSLVTTTGTCGISNVVDKQVLTCQLGDLASGESATVHVVSGTTNNSCATYHNVATVDATNAPEQTADADASVTTCLAVAPTPTHSTHAVAVTGAGPVQSELGLVLVLIGLGGLLLIVGRRPRKGGRHA